MRNGRTDLIGKIVDFAKDNGIIAGVGGHNLETPMECEKAGLNTDFYMKTHHSTNYWSKRQPDQHKDVIDNYDIDNYWDKYPEKTVEFMKTMEKPWIAYKVLAAGDRSGEPLWRLPLGPEYAKQIKSKVADIKNVGNRAAGTITAAAFLQEFVGDVPRSTWILPGLPTASLKNRISPTRDPRVSGSGPF